MAAITGKPWGRYVPVKAYVRYKNGKARKVRASLRKWPGTKTTLYFSY